MSTLHILVLLAVVVAAVHSQTTTSGVKCYVCSGTTGGCADEFSGSSDLEQDCSEYGYSDDNGCSKSKNKTKLFGAWITTTVRTCGQVYDNTNCSNNDRLKINILGIKSETWTCSCEGGLCNSGSKLAMSSVVLLAALIKYLL